MLRVKLAAFVAGFATLGLEVSALRLMTPSFGANQLVFANVVGVLLAALAVGYLAGGRRADRGGASRAAGVALLAAGIVVAALPLASAPLLSRARAALAEGSLSVFVGSFAATALLVAPPAALLGAVPPLLLRLGTPGLEALGRSAGGLFALSTAGSLAGTFLPALLTIPFLGTTFTLVLVGATCALTALPFLGARAAPALVLVLAAGLVRPAGDAGHLLEARETLYQYAAVEEENDGSRVLRVNEGLAGSSFYAKDGGLSYTMYDAFLLAPALRDGGAATLLDLGLAGGTIAREYRAFLPGVRVTGVELDPGVIALGRRWFDLDGKNLEIVVADGRVFLEHTPRRFDAIAVDVFRQPHVPFPFTTREFFSLAKGHLTDGAALVMNVAAFSREDPLLKGILNTAASVFEEVAVFHPALHRNFLLFASGTRGLAERLRRNPVPLEVESWRRAVLDGLEPVRFDSRGPVFTDDRTPAELYGDFLFFRHLAAEGR
jgi:spermidine synthase